VTQQLWIGADVVNLLLLEIETEIVQFFWQKLLKFWAQ